MIKVRDFICASLLLACTAAAADTAAVFVDATDSLHSFSRDLAFGTNVLGEWDNLKLYADNAWRLKQAGIKLLRYPGGTNSNEYHWNGLGHYDSSHVWHNAGSPSVQSFAPGFFCLTDYRGSTPPGYAIPAKLTDGRPDTRWLSAPDEAGAQWIYLDIRSRDKQGVPVNRAEIDWAAPYARRFKIQYSNPITVGVNQYFYNDTAWSDTSSGIQECTGGRSVVPFNTVTAKYVRVCCLDSSERHNQYSISETRLYNDNAQITKNQDDGGQTPTVSSSVCIGDTFERPSKIDFEQFMSLTRSIAPDAEPIITVNFYTGTPEEAADWVYYANVRKGYRIRYWEVGNEVWGNWEAGGPIGSASYARRFAAYYDAMTTVDPTIIVAPQFGDPMDTENVTMDPKTHSPAVCQFYLDNFLKYLKEHGRGNIIKAISVHNYPVFQPKSEAAALANVDQWDRTIPMVKQWIENHCDDPSHVKLFLTEYNDAIDSAFTNHFYDSLFVSTYILNFLKNGGDLGCFFTTFGTPPPFRPDNTTFSDFGMLEGGALNGKALECRNQPRASFYALEMLHNDFSADDSVGNTLVSTNSSDVALKVYANRRRDKKLPLLLVNLDSKRTILANISLKGFVSRGSAGFVTYAGSDYDWGVRDGQAYALPDNPPRSGVIEPMDGDYSVIMDPYSIKVITLNKDVRPAEAR